MQRSGVIPLLAAAFLSLLSAQLLAREGFGISRKSVKLDRVVPPAVPLTSTNRIQVRLSKPGEDEKSARRLRQLIETELTSLQEGLTIDAADPDYVIELEFGASEYRESLAIKPATEIRQTGTRQEWNSRTGRYETRLVYEKVTVQKSFNHVEGSVRAKVHALQRKTGQIVHQSSIEATFDQYFEAGAEAPSWPEIEAELLEQAARNVAAELVGSIEPMAVLLPRGSFDSLIPLAERGAWEGYFEAVHAVPERKRPGDEAYRQYALGVANEAMAYITADLAQSLVYLQTAESHYRRATELKPDEKFFTEAYSNGSANGMAPVARCRDGIAIYQRIAQSRASIASR